MNDFQEDLRQYILKNLFPDESPANLRDDTRLVFSGILDSLATLKLANFVEKTCGIAQTVFDLTPERFDSIRAIAAMVTEKREK